MLIPLKKSLIKEWLRVKKGQVLELFEEDAWPIIAIKGHFTDKQTRGSVGATQSGRSCQFCTLWRWRIYKRAVHLVMVNIQARCLHKLCTLWICRRGICAAEQGGGEGGGSRVLTQVGSDFYALGQVGMITASVLSGNYRQKLAK